MTTVLGSSSRNSTIFFQWSHTTVQNNMAHTARRHAHWTCLFVH